MRHSSASAVDIWIGAVALCNRCRTCTRCCLLAATAKGSIVFTRLRQYAHQLIHCSLSRTNQFSEWQSVSHGFIWHIATPRRVLGGHYRCAKFRL